MPGGPESNDSLLRAIAELRVDLNHLIDEQVAYVKDRVGELAPARGLRMPPALVGSEPQDEPARPRAPDPRVRDRGEEPAPPRPSWTAAALNGNVPEVSEEPAKVRVL